MEWAAADGYTIGRLLVTRGLAALYLVAFLAALLQFRALIGTRGLLPVPAYLAARSFRSSPSLFHFRYSDRLFATLATVGAILAALTLVGFTERMPLVVCMGVWFVMWAFYLSIVNVGQAWYSFGWESLLCEVGFLAVFGIAARNGILMISHFERLERQEGVKFGPGLVIQGAKERLAPIMMTALATGLALGAGFRPEQIRTERFGPTG